jgi:aldehyde dehydrogenase (NAD+)
MVAADGVAAALVRARAEQEAWGALPLRDRADHLRAIRGQLVARADELADVIAAETGKPDFDAVAEVLNCALLLTDAARRVPRVLAAQRVSSFPLYTKRAEIRYVPFGVVGVVSPWNYPAFVPVQALSGVLGAGNTAVLKPSELTSLTGMLLGDIINSAGRELVQVVTGDGTTGAAVCGSGVDKIAFTGSPATARRILRLAADTLTPTVMELGGKDAMIVCDDADVGAAARAAVGACFANAGQTCIAVERVLVTARNHDAFRRVAVEAGRRVAVGPDRSSQVGAITQPSQLDVIEARIKSSVDAGATVVLGGRRRDDLGASFFEPTILDGVTPDMEIARLETFGPVLSIMPVESIDEAISVANASDFGLAGSVFGRDKTLTRRVVDALSTGAVSVNDALATAAIPSLPFGGVRNSGFGRLHGDAGLREFSVTKAVATDRLSGLPAVASLLFGRRRPRPAQVLAVARRLWSR